MHTLLALAATPSAALFVNNIHTACDEASIPLPHPTWPAAVAVMLAAEQARAAGVKLAPTPELLQLLRSADAFTFDVDSTL